jgi:ComF family protein
VVPGFPDNFRRIGSALVRRAFPDCCVFCGACTLGSICFSCRADLPRIENPCGRCNQPLNRIRSRERQDRKASRVDCADCQQRPPPFNHARAAVLYDFPVDVALKAFKFGHALYYVPAFAELLLAEFLLNFDASDALVPVPLHRFRYATRGFNQATELCRHLGRAAGIPVITNIRRTRWTRPQSNLDAASRRRNLEDAFAVMGRLDCRHPLVVDDVMTTGETARHLARTLLDAGARTVNVLTVARAAN